MKSKIILFVFSFLIVAMITNSCKKEEPYVDPVDACFAFPTKTFKVGEIVNFTNCSQYAYSYKWSFGDGSISNERHTQYAYETPGTYSVTLTAYGESGNSQAVQQVVIEASTDLDILVMYYLTNDPVSSANVTLYSTREDWVGYSNPIVSGITDINGSIIFSELNPIIYYVDASKTTEVSNLFYSNEYIGIETEQLKPDQINYYNFYVELLQTPSAANHYKTVIKRIEPTTADDKFRKKYRTSNMPVPTFKANL